MAENEIDEMLDSLRKIETLGGWRSNSDEIERLGMVLEVFRTFIRCHHFLCPDSLVKLTKMAKCTVQVLDGVFPNEWKTNLNLAKSKSKFVEFFEGNTSLSYNYGLNYLNLSDYMDFIGWNLCAVLMFLQKWVGHYDKILWIINPLKIVLRKIGFLSFDYATLNFVIDHEKLECLETRIEFMADNVGQLCLAVLLYRYDKIEHGCMERPPYLLCLIVLVELEMEKIYPSEPKASKSTLSTTFRDENLGIEFSRHLHSLLMYLRNKKLENFPNNISAQNIDVAIDYLLVFLGADVSNHVIDGDRLNEILLKVGAIAGDVLYVILKLLPAGSTNNDDTSKISLCSIQILEETKNLKAQVETYYKSLEFTPSQFPTFGGLSFLDSLLRKLNEMPKSNSGLDFLMKPLLDNLAKELSSLTPILEKELISLTSIFRDVAEVHHEHKNLQRRTVNLAYEAEVAIDSILAQYNAFVHIFCSLPTILKKINQINAEVTEIRLVDVALKPQYVVAPSKHLPTRHINPVTDEEIVGFENDTYKMIQYLLRGTNELDVVPIVGMAGQGKTTIARKLYDKDIIVSHFDVRAWCTISQTYNRRELLQEIFSQVTGSKDKEDDVAKLADELRKRLMRRRYLIVLDDMWDDTAWDDLRLSFPDYGNGSRIVVTTRLEEVGKHVKYHTDPYSLPFLTTEESCQLLQKKVFQNEDFPPKFQDVSQAVAEKCKGLPLVVVLVAGIIKKRKMEESWWNEVKDALFDYLDRESQEFSQATMQLSYDNLLDYLKPCLLYMGMFPEDARIPVSKLISFWIAEGFVHNIESGRSMEEAAEGFMMELIHSNVVMVSKREYNGKVKYCQVHDVVHHFCLEKSREENFMLAVRGLDSQFQPLEWKGSRVRYSFSEELSKFASLGSKTQKPFHQHLRSLILTNTSGESFGLIPCSQISELRLLKVLDLSSHYLERLSSATFKPLIHLKYLAVRPYIFDFYPESHLPCIETLIVENNDPVLLPASLWEMEKLRHVDIRMATFDAEEDKQGAFEGSSKLENLRILRQVHLTGEADSLDMLLQRFLNLQQLEIVLEGNFAESFELKLGSLMQLQGLRFSLFSNNSVLLQLPSNLKKLELEGFHTERVITFIEGLSNLEYLKLQSDYYVESREWCLENFTFHELKFLKLVSLNISKWNVSKESFPLLETLVIKGCQKLEEIPNSFEDIPTLKHIKLIRCNNKSLEASAVIIKDAINAIAGYDWIDLIIE